MPVASDSAFMRESSLAVQTWSYPNTAQLSRFMAASGMGTIAISLNGPRQDRNSGARKSREPVRGIARLSWPCIAHSGGFLQYGSANFGARKKK